MRQPLSESKPSGTGEQDSLYFRVRITMGVSSVVETTVTQLIASVWKDYFLQQSHKFINQKNLLESQVLKITMTQKQKPNQNNNKKNLMASDRLSSHSLVAWFPEASSKRMKTVQ